MPNSSSPFQHHASPVQGNRQMGEASTQSPEGESSGLDSENELPDQNGSHGGNRGMKRKRPIMVSCELCKQRKVKCDRGQPSCGWCARNGQPCEYRERKKPGLRAGYGKELEQRLDRLEEIIQAQARLIETHVIQRPPPATNDYQPPPVPAYTPSSEPSAATGPSPRTGLYPQESASIPISNRHVDTASVNQDLAIRSPSDTSAKYSSARPQNGMHASTALSHVGEANNNDFSRNESSLEVPVDLFQNQKQSLANSEVDLPPYDLLYALVDLYFEHINSWCPILHRRTTLDTFFGPSPLEEADRVVLHAIVATALRFSNDPRLHDQNRQHYHDSSKQRVLLYGIENSSVKALQALAILALDFVGSSNGPPGWKLLALIARSVVQLGLSVEAGSSLVSSVYPSIYTLRAVVLPEPESWVEDESRRRLFWMVYLLDRYSTIATAFDFALDDKDIDRRLPCRDDFFVKNEPVETRYFRTAQSRSDYANGSNEMVGSFGFYVEILGILSRIHIFLKRPVDIGVLSDVEEWQSTYRKLDSELSSWEFNLPTEYAHENASRLLHTQTKASKAFHCDWVMLQAAYQTAVIRLHSSAAYPTTRSPIFTPSYSAGQRCLVAVDNILALTRFVVDNNLLDRLGPPFAFTVWVSARLLLVHGSTIAHTVNPDIFLFVDTLARMGRYWKVAERYSTILKRVLDEYREYEQAVATDGDRMTPSSVKILADMRRCAFDLDFLISRQPRSAHNLGTPNVGPASTPLGRNLGPNELEYLDIFGFFNVPKVPSAPGFSMDPNNANANINELSSQTPTTHNPMSIHGITSAENPPGATHTLSNSTSHPAVANHSNEFNITNFMIPTPETDWLFQPPA